MGSESALAEWTSKPCITGIDEARRGPVLGAMVYGCLYCALSYQKTLSTLNFADSKTLKEEKREKLFEELKVNESIGWAMDVIDPREHSAKMLMGDAEKHRVKLSERFPSIKFAMAKRADSLYPVVSSASIVAKVWLKDHKHNVFVLPSLVRFSWGTCTSHYKDLAEVLWESDKMDDDGCSSSRGKHQLKLSNVGFASSKKRSEEIESSGKGCL